MKDMNNIDIAYYSDLSQAEKILVEGDIQLIAKRSLTGVNIAHNIELIHVLNKTYGYKPEVLLVYSDEILIGFIPLSILHNKAISLPHFSYGGYCGLFELERINIDKIIESLSMKYSGGFVIRGFQPYSKYVSTEKVAYYLRLEKSSDDQFSVFHKKLRSQIRKATKNGVTVVSGSLKDFYAIYTENMHYKHGSPHLSQELFDNLLHSYSSGEVKIFTAKFNDKVIGSCFMIGFHDFIEVCWAATSLKYNHLAPNMILYWTMISYAVDHKYKIFSFGRTSRDSGPQRFKKQWGAVEIPLIWSFDKEFDSSHSKFNFLTKAWKLTPSFLTNPLSPALTKYIY
jgi:hypothetical protein